MRTLVTGGAGFIGSHLVERLVSEGMEVVVLDNLSNGRTENLAHLESSSVTFVEGDVCNRELVRELLSGVDWVFHLAALADIVPSIEKPDAYFQSNVDGTFVVVEEARKQNVKRFVYAASSSCYGIPDEFPTKETADIRPMYPYALTKYLGEELVMHWCQVYGLPSVSLRFFNVYGPRARTSGTYGAVFGVFLAQKLAGKPFTIVGDGEQTRDFTFVSDLADALFTAASSDVSGEIYNVGSGSTYSVNRLVELLGGEKTYIPKRPGEPDCTFADTARIERDLGWKARTPFEEGVKIMLENIDYWRDAPVWTEEKIEVATRGWHHYLGEGKE